MSKPICVCELSVPLPVIRNAVADVIADFVAWARSGADSAALSPPPGPVVVVVLGARVAAGEDEGHAGPADAGAGAGGPPDPCPEIAELQAVRPVAVQVSATSARRIAGLIGLPPKRRRG